MSVPKGEGFSGALAAALDAAGVEMEDEEKDGETSGTSPPDAEKPSGDKPEPAKTEAGTSGQESRQKDDDGEVSMSHANLVVAGK